MTDDDIVKLAWKHNLCCVGDGRVTNAYIEGADWRNELIAFARALLAASPAAQAEYTDAVGRAGQDYHARFPHAHPLPGPWRWQELWDVMARAALKGQPAPEPTPPEWFAHG